MGRDKALAKRTARSRDRRLALTVNVTVGVDFAVRAPSASVFFDIVDGTE
jgi:hypothetical protein